MMQLALMLILAGATNGTIEAGIAYDYEWIGAYRAVNPVAVFRYSKDVATIRGGSLRAEWTHNSSILTGQPFNNLPDDRAREVAGFLYRYDFKP